MKTIRKYGVIALFAVIMAGCASTAHIEKDESADLKKYKSYTWVTSDVKESEKSDITNLAAQNIRNSVNMELQKNGWREVKSNPDVLLSYDVNVERNTRTERDPVYSNGFTRMFYNPYLRRYQTIYYPSRFLGYDEEQVPIKEGTVTITMVDRKTNKTIWQGWTTDELSSNKLTSKDIQKNVKTIFKKFEVE